jgi:hypothetical protein
LSAISFSKIYHTTNNLLRYNNKCSLVLLYITGNSCHFYRSAGKSLPRPTSLCFGFDGENISFDASFDVYIYINSTNIPPIMIINMIYRGADKSLARPSSRYVLFDGENISFDDSLVIYIYICIYLQL